MLKNPELAKDPEFKRRLAEFEQQFLNDKEDEYIREKTAFEEFMIGSFFFHVGFFLNLFVFGLSRNGKVSFQFWGMCVVINIIIFIVMHRKYSKQ